MATEAHRLAEIVRGKDPLDGLCKERLITPEGCDWLKSALDPFHDFQLDNMKGYPDISTEPTVIVQVRQSKTISAPPNLADGATWDCHFALSPVDYAQPGPAHASTIRGVRVKPGVTADSGLVEYLGSSSGGSPLCGRMDGLMINSVPSTGSQGLSSLDNMTYTPGHCLAVTSASTTSQMQGIHLDDFVDFDATDLGVYRLVYSGFEVVNTTAQIAKQGSVTVYEYGNSYEVASKHETNGAFSAPNTYFRCPPNTLAEAKIMPGAHTWAAQDGCYNTAKFQTDNPFQAATSRNFTFSQNNPDYVSASSGYLPVSGASTCEYGSFASCNSVLESTQDIPTTHFSRMNTTGAYFTGLSSSTTLFVTWRVGIERLPSANRPMFLALAQPSATYDPNALVLYNLVAAALPPGCPQGYNDGGKWFQWIANNARKAIPTVYPIVRTAAMMAASLGRPVIGSALGALAANMRPVAEDMAARRLQGAARRQNGRGGGQQGKRPAVGNFTKPSPRGQVKGGTNGLR